MPQPRRLYCLPWLWLLSAGFNAPLAAQAPAPDQSPLLENIRQLTFAGRRAGEGYFSADGKRMVFQSERTPDNPFFQIFVLDLETGDTQQVSPGIGKTTCGWIHPREDKVLYASTHQDPEASAEMQAELDFRASGQIRRYAWDYDPHFEIYAQSLDGGEPINLTNSHGYDAEGAYSPDGETIVFASNRTAYSEPMTPEQTARFAYDQSFMMDLYLMDADGGDVQRLTDAPGYDGGPFFSFDGQRITWRRFSEDGARAEIYTMDLDTRQERQITDDGGMSWAPFFHPSGDYLIFTSNALGFANFELFIVDATGRGDPVRVTHSQGFDGLPAFAPDGRQLTWTSNRTPDGGSQIFLADWDDAAARQLLGLAPLDAPGVPATPGDEGEAIDFDLSVLEPAIRASDARHHVERLTADDMAGRLTGTVGARRATAYVAAAFGALGLAPAGDEGYFQPFAFTRDVSLGDGNQLRLNLPEGHGQPTLGSQWQPLALSTNGAVAAHPVAFAGYGIVAPEGEDAPAYDSYGELDVADHWVLVLRFWPRDIPAAHRRHWVHYADLAYKAAVAKRRGAVGLIVATGPEAEASSRLVPLAFDLGAGFEGAGILGLSIDDALATALLGGTDKDLAGLQASLDRGETLDAFVLPGVEVQAQVDLVRQRGAGRNVLGRLAAPNSPGGALIIGAHVDHLGRGETSGSLATGAERGAIHPGADDNASGVAALLEIAHFLAHQRQLGRLALRRDVVFAAWSGEELGTLGSSHFVAAATRDGGELADRVAAYLNLDMVGRLRDSLYLQGTGSSSVWATEIERRNVPVGLAVTPQQDPYLPTDSTPFYLAGAPVLNAFTGAHEDYSTPRDRADALNYPGLESIARLMGGIVRSLATADQPPDYQSVARSGGDIGRRHLRAYLGTIPAYGQADDLKGVQLQGAVEDGPAAAGVLPGDVLVELAGTPVVTIHDFMAALAALEIGTPTELVVMRDGQRLSLTVVPGARE
ncbi:MAG: M28 family peptidase [Candidatus Competibacterales bacterium]